VSDLAHISVPKHAVKLCNQAVPDTFVTKNEKQSILSVDLEGAYDHLGIGLAWEGDITVQITLTLK
jgi:hypothetical protein